MAGEKTLPDRLHAFFPSHILRKMQKQKNSQGSRMETMGAAGHGLYRHLWAARARSNRRRALIGSWVTPPTTRAIKIKRGGDGNITINHDCVDGNCGGSCNSDGNSNDDGGGGNGCDGGGSSGDGGDGGGRESVDGVGDGRGDDSNEQQQRQRR